MTPMASGEPVRPPRAWVGLAFSGAFLYGGSKLMEFYPKQASHMTTFSTSTLATYLPLTAIAGTILFFAGLVAALWRANRAAGRTGAAAAGVTLGTLGVLVFLGEAVALLVNQLSLPVAIPAPWLGSVAIEDLVGTFLASVGLAGLAWGLARAAGLSVRRRAALGPYRGSYERTYEGHD